MKPVNFIASVCAALCLGAAAQAETLIVTSSADAGEGSLRAALLALSETGGQIELATEGDVVLTQTLTYTGTAPITISGSGQSLIAGGDFTVFAATQGADVALNGLNLRGQGGYSITSQSAHGAAAGKGLFIDLRDDQTGTVTLSLRDVTVADVAGHGIHVSDCSLADDCGGGSGGAGGGSAASIAVNLVNVTVDGAGYGRFDADGLRVDERAEGSILFNAVGSRFVNVGADGVELDEGQAGDVVVSVLSSVFNDNGGYCDPAVLNAFLPSPDEAEFELGAMAESAVPAAVNGSPDDLCIEREVDLYDDGSVEEYAFGIDLDDGFDVDEAGPGGIIATLSGSQINGNLDEGLDFDEEDAGGVDLTLVGVTASGNRDDGFKTSEEDAGDVVATMTASVAETNGGVGVVFEEEDAGDVSVTVQATTTQGNDDGDLGLEVVQDGDGMGHLVVLASDISEGVEAEGIAAQ